MRPITTPLQKIRCLQCSKQFSSQVELRIHEKVKHQAAFKDNSQNINSSDLSDDEEREINIVRGQPIKQQEMNKPSTKLYEANTNRDSYEKNPDGASKRVLPTKLQNPIMISDEEKKVYLCGCEHKTFDSAAALSLHIKKQHNGFPPQGTLYGVCRQLVRRHFQPMEQKDQIIRPQIQKTDFVCGCGLSYPRISSLRFHIRHNHNGQPPVGTIGLTKDGPNNENSQGEQSTESKQNSDVGQLPRCKNCFQLCKEIKWICENCLQWKICKTCIQHQEVVRQHQQTGHNIRLIDC